jgi:hypothetical protein
MIQTLRDGTLVPVCSFTFPLLPLIRALALATQTVPVSNPSHNPCLTGFTTLNAASYLPPI